MSPDDPSLPFGPEDSEGRPRRVALDGEVSLKFKEHPGFFEERSANLSPGGMFIRSGEPQPPGTVFDFELTLEGEPRLIHGIGEVAWAREADEGFDRPPGMGVRFLSLEPESREVIDRLVAERLEETEEAPAPPAWLGTPAAAPELEMSSEMGPEGAAETGIDSDADDEPPVVPRMPGPSPYAYARSYRGSGVSRESRRRGPLLAVLLALALLVALAAAFFLLFPETAMRLLLGEGGGDGEPDEVVEVVAGEEATVGEPEPVVPVEPAPETDAGAAEAPPEEAEDEMGFFDPPAETPAPAPEAAPAPAPAPPPPPAPAPGEDGRAFSRVLNLIWEPRDDEILVTVFLDGPIEEWEYTVTRLSEPPRSLVVIRGISQPFPRTEIPVGAELVERLRVGFHPERPRSELHVVVDLADPGADLVRSEAAGQELRLFIGRPPSE